MSNNRLGDSIVDYTDGDDSVITVKSMETTDIRSAIEFNIFTIDSINYDYSNKYHKKGFFIVTKLNGVTYHLIRNARGALSLINHRQFIRGYIRNSPQYHESFNEIDTFEFDRTVYYFSGGNTLIEYNSTLFLTFEISLLRSIHS